MSDTGAPRCERCGKSYWVHTGIERFCPCISTYRGASPGEHAADVALKSLREALTPPKA